MPQTHEITDLLQAWSRGDEKALAQLIPLVDHELKKIAHAYMLRERPGHTLQTTALVNEALLRLLGGEKIEWRSRAHFYALAARRMRFVLIEHARQEKAAKRGARAEHLNLSDAPVLTAELSEELLELDEALIRLAQIDERKAQIVELRYFMGFTVEEIAVMLGIATATVEREWRFTRSWLKDAMA